MADDKKERRPRLSEYCPVCKELMWNTENIGHICVNCEHLDGDLLYNPKTGNAYDETDFEIILAFSGGLDTNEVQLHLRDAGIESGMISIIKKQWGDKEFRRRVKKLFSGISWPPYDHLLGEGNVF